MCQHGVESPESALAAARPVNVSALDCYAWMQIY